MGLPEAEIKQRLSKTVSAMHIQNLLDRSIFNLSGGEKQKIACAGVSAMLPELIVLDEPTSNLDLKAIAELRTVIAAWKAQGKTVIIAEHRLGWLSGLCDRVLFMEKGRISAEYAGDAFFSFTAEKLNGMGLRAFRASRNYLESKPGLHCIRPFESVGSISLTEFKFSYRKHTALNIGSLTLPEGSVTAIVGHNGAGKSTFTRCLCGLQRGFKGRVSIGGKTLRPTDMMQLSYMVMQDVNHQLFAETVLEEVLLGADETEKDKALSVLEKLDIAI